ncbi:hypothetical protein Syun_028106 [Stephania yunnanensis]|uniref:C2 domain-containing protein n=1 Tax=Stephania yunnanensis TaxID=152371 RepID=A0AAP0HRV0_9MAGN
MDITEVTVLHHVVIVLLLIWFLSSVNFCHPIFYVVSLIYLYQVNESYTLRLQKKIRFEEKKQANQKRVLSDSESVRWLNYAVEKIWPVCMEQIASQKMLLPIVPWFLEKYKPWTAEKAIVQQLYLGRRPPMFTEIRVLHQSSGDDHLVMELGMNFLAANDMSAIIAVKLRKTLGFGMWVNLHMTGMHVEGKVLLGVKFLQHWPYVSRLRICFVDPPYFQMTVKPLFNHGLDVTEVPGIAGWLDKLLAVAFEQTLVEPNMLVVDMEKFAMAPTENWFSVDEKDPIACATVEIIEAADLRPADLNGLADPFVKGQIGSKTFRTKIQKKTLSPKWLEEFKFSIHTWESPNMLAIEVLDKDHFYDDTLGKCVINISDMRGGQRHDLWLPLQNVKMGRLHLAVTVTDANAKDMEHIQEQGKAKKEENMKPDFDRTSVDSSESTVNGERASKLADYFEPISIEGNQEIGIWVHRPGSDVSQTWEARKGKTRQPDSEILREDNDSRSPRSVASGSNVDGNSSSDENSEKSKSKALGAVHRSLKKIGSVFRKGSGKDDGEDSPSTSLKQAHEGGLDVQSTMVKNHSGEIQKSPENDLTSPAESPGTRKRISNGLKHAFSRKRSNDSRTAPAATQDYQGSEASNEGSSSKLDTPPS